MMSKLVPVVRNISQSDLGWNKTRLSLAIAIKENVHIGFGSRAWVGQSDLGWNKTRLSLAIAIKENVHITTTKMVMHKYDDIIDIKAMRPYNPMGFAKKCSKLELFLHFSTAYVSLPRTGTIMEKMVSMTDITKRDDNLNSNNKSLVRFLPAVILENEIKLIADCKKTFTGPTLAVKELSELGLQRANKFGWPNTYMFVKAMGEMIINSIREDVPVVIIRPSIVEGTYKEPFPGWIEGFKGMDPVALSNKQGKLTGLIGTLAGVLDVNLLELNYQHFKLWPCIHANGKPITIQKLKIITSIEAFDTYLFGEAKISNSPVEKVERIKFMDITNYMAKCYGPFTFYHYRFNISNTERLWENMTKEEKKKFGFVLKTIDWKHYILNVHNPGLRRHINMKSNMPIVKL
ncbi:Male sterility, NAD-binding protein [Corchorus olitorius]|uniref:Fatty acyl-CoA reductase n=1 Tax=Corchorus olitorius TaxID=93759 RepID=A0A1R3HER1_9ROSI|nr:Male sterility, NAD-binding protein [Corchorus olitorius]